MTFQTTQISRDPAFFQVSAFVSAELPLFIVGQYPTKKLAREAIKAADPAAIERAAWRKEFGARGEKPPTWAR